MVEGARLGFYALPMRVSYRRNARHSHFRPIMDIARITRMVAWKLVKRGLYLRPMAQPNRSFI